MDKDQILFVATAEESACGSLSPWDSDLQQMQEATIASPNQMQCLLHVRHAPGIGRKPHIRVIVPSPFPGFSCMRL